MEFLCEECKTTDEHKFARSRPNLCKDCKKNQKPYKCKYCGDENKDNFTEGRYGICKKCRSSENAKYIKDKRRQNKFQHLAFSEEVEDEINASNSGTGAGAPVEINPEMLPTLKAIDLGVEKFIFTNRKIMNGYTIQEILENFSSYNIHKNKEDAERDFEIECLKDEILQLKFLISECNINF